ncbi:hydrolase 1, exosortase A system-associated [Pontixanthobacter aestiaquae]|uniref:Hydrolase 1, exosortase A system-associated n=1 Tax=Pontixanthobacter aestiaquae TaxID=1509367 RepID=A0A844Z7D7_9SPHN|nr:hydrolase 1, exosortase A system-associated [Pontixanthobacter aestiaquae]MDN3645270.1 hydrolase 1, exosortase A system-associated [Pontixanthobacter aestiaquae]MXO83728.1 hydrolase 1, exosortase A system-associated [Pontixanthobacter aestiaquae]
MSRLSLTFECQGRCLAGTLDTAPGKTGLLIVSGGNEVRAGTFSGQAKLAAKLASAGFPIFRFDRRGIGDSDGENRGFTNSQKDIAAALEAFRAINPQMTRVIGFGNCDAASALMLAGGSDLDGLILSNPWTIEDGCDDTPPPRAVRSRYIEKLKNPQEVWRLLTGGVNLRKLFGGLKQAASSSSTITGLAQQMAEGISGYDQPIRILLASSDRTAQVFLENWDASDARIATCENASHAYVEPHARAWLEKQILSALRA